MKKQQEEVAKDIIAKLQETNQIYLMGHDTPLSISKYLFYLLDLRRRLEAKSRGIPEDQFEFEDIIGLLLGLPVGAPQPKPTGEET